MYFIVLSPHVVAKRLDDGWLIIQDSSFCDMALNYIIELYFRDIVQLHEIFKSITCNQNFRFMSHLLKDLMEKDGNQFAI